VLGNAATLARSLHRDIAALAKILETAATVEEQARLVTDKPQASEYHRAELVFVIAEIKKLLDRIDRDAPLIQLAIIGSGESLSTSIPPGISPSRFLQASAFLNLGDTQFASDPTRPVQIGPSLTLSLYMLFVGHGPVPATQNGDGAPVPRTPDQAGRREKPRATADYGYGEGDRKPIWKEVLHKCRVRLCRTPLDWGFDPERGYYPKTSTSQAFSEWKTPDPYGWPDEFAYSMEIIEDLDDGRVHDDGESAARPYDGIAWAGLRECIPVYQISKIFYTDTGKILNICNGNDYENHPVLLLKRDENAVLPSKRLEDGVMTQAGSPLHDNFSTSTASDIQANIDQQLLDESQRRTSPSRDACAANSRRWALPPDLDPEWIALEVFVDDDQDDLSDSDSDAADVGTGDGDVAQIVVKKTRASGRPSVDAKLITQIRNISIRSSLGPFSGNDTRPSSRDTQNSPLPSPEQLVARSPFGNIASSLSLLEMLVRLTSLQETQQAAHLSIPDHILSFFLEEASTTGLRGEERWKIRDEAKRRVGFDPYTDTPAR